MNEVTFFVLCSLTSFGDFRSLRCSPFRFLLWPRHVVVVVVVFCFFFVVVDVVDVVVAVGDGRGGGLGFGSGRCRRNCGGHGIFLCDCWCRRCCCCRCSHGAVSIGELGREAPSLMAAQRTFGTIAEAYRGYWIDLCCCCGQVH